MSKFTHYNTMTTGIITIQDFVYQNIIYCISSLIHELTQKGCLDEETAIELWQGPIDFDSALYEINQDGSHVAQKDGLWGLYDNDEPNNPIVDYEYETRDELIKWYFNDMSWSIDNHRTEVFEHWICSDYLGRKLIEHGHTVIEVFGLTVWARPTTGMAIAYDHVIEMIYQEMISK